VSKAVDFRVNLVAVKKWAQQLIPVTKPLCDLDKQNWLDTNYRRHFSADLRRR
jgi:hypothetical protein